MGESSRVKLSKMVVDAQMDGSSKPFRLSGEIVHATFEQGISGSWDHAVSPHGWWEVTYLEAVRP